MSEIGVLRFSGGLAGKESACNAGDLGLSPGEGNGYPLTWSILAWRILWTEEPGGLQSMGSQRVGHDLATENQQQQASRTHSVLLGNVSICEPA